MNQPAAIVLGARVAPDGSPTRSLRRRAEAAAALYHEGRVDRIVASGGIVGHPPAESEAIGQILAGAGVPSTRIIIEDRSRNTLENIVFSRDLLPPGTPVVLVSDAWHLPRARLVARRLGLSATTAHPPLRGARPWPTAKGLAREAVAFLIYLVRPMR